ncbi:MAG: AHH domain-containing protein [Sediminibacterium sp.]|uniref:AHH domain-containing protein n=1 Tax=Sediminibacterium sp. TaxID=1917865 RepID=UPI00271E76D5|nr:AHH domain-containing protein [Sediminibacterium sp.]MDO8995512.1 AHH domain-containing protein [Sediminibacterium sp.]
MAHHVITFHQRVRNHQMMQMAMRAGFDYNDAAQNGKAIAASLNSGNHDTYADKIVAALEIIKNNPPPGGINPTWAREKVDELVNSIRNVIDNNPGVHVDNLIF